MEEEHFKKSSGEIDREKVREISEKEKVLVDKINSKSPKNDVLHINK